jgi:hypothetical protein
MRSRRTSSDTTPGKHISSPELAKLTDPRPVMRRPSALSNCAKEGQGIRVLVGLLMYLNSPSRLLSVYDSTTASVADAVTLLWGCRPLLTCVACCDGDAVDVLERWR